MPINLAAAIDLKALFLKLYNAKTEEEVDEMTHFLRANARFQIGQYEAAAADFEALENSFQYKYDAKWNYLLCQLALGEMEVVQTQLTNMIADEDFPFHAQAVELKGRLSF